MTSDVLNYLGPYAGDNCPPGVRGITIPHTVGDHGRQVAEMAAETTGMRFCYSRCDSSASPTSLGDGAS
jgi:hypothetical protein